MKSARSVILKPVVSEKAYSLIDDNVYTFVVAAGAKKTEIRQAVEAIWGVKVVSVNTVNRAGKRKRSRTTFGRTDKSKRAIVRLAEGDKIELFETR